MVFSIHYYIAMKPSLILFFIILNHAFAEPGDRGIRHKPWLHSGKYYCSAENDEDVADIEEASKEYYQLKYCLFEKIFQRSQEKLCKKEINLVFHKIMGIEGGQCGTTSYQIKHAFSQYDCGDQTDLEKFKDENFQKDPVPQDFSRLFIYTICYDIVEKKVLWTTHNIHPPKVFRNLRNQIQPEMPAISTDPYFMMPSLFSILETQYALEEEKNPSAPDTFIMVPRPLIPPEHFAIHLTKKSTNHYINMAPLWKNLVPLMKTIDQGIKQAQMKLESENPESYDKFIIHTKVVPSKNDETTSEAWFNLLLFQGNIWYKLIYREAKKAAVMIIIHNTPGKTPSKGCLVGEQKECEFEKWSKDESITSDNTKYAFCCEITMKDVEDVFSQIYDIDEYLKIHDLATEGKSLE